MLQALNIIQEILISDNHYSTDQIVNLVISKTTDINPNDICMLVKLIETQIKNDIPVKKYL